MNHCGNIKPTYLVAALLISVWHSTECRVVCLSCTLDIPTRRLTCECAGNAGVAEETDMVSAEPDIDETSRRAGISELLRRGHISYSHPGTAA